MSVRRFSGTLGVFVAITVLAACSNGSVATAPSTSAAASTSATPSVEVGLVITPKSRTDLSNFSQFTYDDVSASGLSSEAAKPADDALHVWVQSTVDEGVAANGDDCGVDSAPCGLFQLQVLAKPCVEQLLCALQSVGAAWPGAGTGDERELTIVIDPKTGLKVNLDQYLSAAQMQSFLKSVSKAAAVWQRNNESDFGAYEPQPSQIAWLPLDDGIHVWAPKYSIGSGANGVVELVVANPKSATQSSARSTEESASPESKPGLHLLATTQATPVISDLGFDAPAKCYDVNAANSDSNWAVVWTSAYGGKHVDYCMASDSSVVIKREGGKWSMTDAAGILSCNELSDALAQAGADSAVIDDFMAFGMCGE